MKTKREDWKMQGTTQSRSVQSADEGIIAERSGKPGNLDHAERGQFIPFAEALKKLG